MFLLLRRLVGLKNLHHLSHTFDLSSSALLELHNVMLDPNYHFTKQTMALARRGCRIPSCCGFVDGKLFKIRRQREGEDAAFSQWKCMHATKYQVVVLSNVMIAGFDGPNAGSVGDANI
eukprot:scaffold420_cov342-Pavlova_lutheri.AAC.8